MNKWRNLLLTHHLPLLTVPVDIAPWEPRSSGEPAKFSFKHYYRRLLAFV